MNKDRHDDSELKGYLEGGDGVSTAYRKSSGEQPPPALDVLILDAARAAVSEKPQPRREALPFGTRHAMAASFVVGVLVTTLYFNRNLVRVAEPEVATQRVTEAAPSSGVGEDANARAPEAAAQLVNDAMTAAVEAAAPDAEALAASAQQELDVAPAIDLPPVEFAERSVGPTLEVTPARSVPELDTATRNAEMARQQALTVEASRLQEAVAEANQALAAEEAAQGALEEVQVTGARIEEPEEEEIQITGSRVRQPEEGEIMVTGSRIVRGAELDTSYRESQGSWLEEIRALQAEVEMLEERIAAGQEVEILDVVSARLEEERELFAEAYPEVDLDEALEEEGLR